MNKKLHTFLVTIDGIGYRVNAENERQAKVCAVAVSVKRGDCTDAEFSAAKFEGIVDLGEAGAGGGD